MKNKTQKLYWVFQISGWTIYALFILFIVIFFTNQFDQRFIINILTKTLFSLVISHGLRYIIIQKDLLKKKLNILVPRILLLTLVSSLAIQLLDAGFKSLYDLLFKASSIHDDLFSKATLFNLIYDSIIFFMWNVFYFSFHYITNFKREELKNLQWEAAINEIELNKLKSQLNPHFIFNSMNGIRALIDEDPKKAKISVTKLANILRNTLVMNRKKIISFEEEMKLVYDYLDLEGIRFEERLTTHFDINPISNQFFVPPLMLQTIVENAIKHGISNLESGGEIIIQTNIIDNKLNIEIKNTGTLQSDYMEHTTGFGLSNTQQRLILLYGDKADFSLTEENGYVVAKLLIPKYIDFSL